MRHYMPVELHLASNFVSISFDLTEKERHNFTSCRELVRGLRRASMRRRVTAWQVTCAVCEMLEQINQVSDDAKPASESQRGAPAGLLMGHVPWPAGHNCPPLTNDSRSTCGVRTSLVVVRCRSQFLVESHWVVGVHSIRRTVDSQMRKCRDVSNWPVRGALALLRPSCLGQAGVGNWNKGRGNETEEEGEGGEERGSYAPTEVSLVMFSEDNVAYSALQTPLLLLLLVVLMDRIDGRTEWGVWRWASPARRSVFTIVINHTDNTAR